jgi:hypothetical protein
VAIVIRYEIPYAVLDPFWPKNMSLSPPLKGARPAPENVRALKAGLTSVVAGHPQVHRAVAFYEEVDQYLGPWGNKGYPIAYDKFYCIVFNTNQKLDYSH